jgi:RNAse (barnase) inhibitor barstar
MPSLHDILSEPALNDVYRLTTAPELVPVLDGRGLKDKDSLLAAVGRALDFPDYYGGNWDALEECLADLSWREGPVWLFIHHADAIPAEPRAILLDVFAEAARAWAREGRVFDLFLAGLEQSDLPEAD